MYFLHASPVSGIDTSAGPLPSTHTLGNMLQVVYLQKTKPKQKTSLKITFRRWEPSPSMNFSSENKFNCTLLAQETSVSSPKRVKLCRLWQSFMCLPTHCQSLLLKSTFLPALQEQNVNEYKVIASSSQEELCEPQFQLHLQQEIWPLRSLADITVPMAASQSLVSLGEEITEHQNYITLKFQDEGDSKSYQRGIEKAKQECWI